MKEIVNEILKEEDAARKVIEKTRLVAEEIVADAKNKAKSYLEKAETDLKQFLAQKQASAEKQFLTEKEKILKETEEESIRLRKSWEKDIPAIAKNLFSQVISKKE
jgi:vacuolar-type H+-ATPase subunit H